MRFVVPLSLALVVTAAAVPMQAGQSTPAQSSVTFTKDVAPILQKNCQVCHRPGSIAPMPLLNYEQARPWARSIKEQVILRQMPPWFIDKNVGVQHFSNDRSLTESEIDIIAKDGFTIVFVEVKARKTQEFGGAAAAMTGWKQRRIARMAVDYLARQNLHDCPCRFDVVAIDFDQSEPRVIVYPNAFDAPF